VQTCALPISPASARCFPATTGAPASMAWWRFTDACWRGSLRWTGEQPEGRAMGMVAEFKEFIARGNVVDLAVAVVIGAAFGKIVTALVDGIVMPLVGVATGGVSVSDWKYVVTPAGVDAAGAEVAEVAIAYGAFIQTVIDFLLIALVVFLFLRAY